MHCNEIYNAAATRVLMASEEDTKCYVKSISVVIFGLQGPVDCELVLIKDEKEIFKSSRRLLCNQIVVHVT